MGSLTQFIGEKPGTRRSEVSADGARRYYVTYMVLASTVSAKEDHVLRTYGIPRMGTPNLFHPFAFVDSLTARRVPDSSEAWEVDAVWESTPGQRQDERTKPPWERPARIRFDEVPVDDFRLHDLDGKYFLNTAKDPFENQPAISRSDIMVTIELAELEYDELDAAKWGNKINSKMWRGYPPFAALMHMPIASDAYYTTDVLSEQYWNVVYRIWIKSGCFDDPPDLWKPLKVLNQGSREIVTVDAGGQVLKRRFCTDDDDVASTEPQLLDAEGKQMTRDDIEAIGPHWVEFKVYDARDFSELFPGV